MHDRRVPPTVASCDQFMCRLQSLLDERHEPNCDQALRAHADVCPACRATMELQVRVLRVWSAQSVDAQSFEDGGNGLRNRKHELAVRASGVRRDAGGGRLRGNAEVFRPLIGLALSLVCLVAAWRWAGSGVDQAATLARVSSAVPDVAGGERAANSARPISLPDAVWRNEARPQEARSWTLADSEERAGLFAWRGAWGDLEVDLDWDVSRWLATTNRSEESAPVWLRPVHGGLAPFAHSLTSTLNVLKLTWPSGRPGDPSAQGEVDLEKLGEVSAAGRPS
jgi:hypothetical protein